MKVTPRCANSRGRDRTGLEFDMTHRTCMDCSEDLPESEEFFPREPRTGYLRRRCRPCWKVRRESLVDPEAKRIAQARYYARNKEAAAAKQRAYYAANRDAVRMRNRFSQLKCIYGLTKEQYEDMLSQQNGTCAFCDTTDGYFLCVDHDHETGQIRGLLCRLCNSALGRLGDNEAGILRVLEYLRAAPEPDSED